MPIYLTENRKSKLSHISEQENACLILRVQINSESKNNRTTTPTKLTTIANLLHMAAINSCDLNSVLTKRLIATTNFHHQQQALATETSCDLIVATQTRAYAKFIPNVWEVLTADLISEASHSVRCLKGLKTTKLQQQQRKLDNYNLLVAADNTAGCWWPRTRAAGCTSVRAAWGKNTLTHDLDIKLEDLATTMTVSWY